VLILERSKARHGARVWTASEAWAGRRARRVEFAKASVAVLRCAVREADARFTRCTCCSLLVVRGVSE
jgi:hypothetical protein